MFTFNSITKLLALLNTTEEIVAMAEIMKIILTLQQTPWQTVIGWDTCQDLKMIGGMISALK